ncbi:argininosuccinate lyase [bacterium]|jgi:argininosuccinate lyase|nr:argininosuccinate lyase [bacterium]
MGKLWGGRFKKSLDDSAMKLSYSFHFDKQLLPYDIQTNSAHVKALCKAGLFTEEERDLVLNCLSQLDYDSVIESSETFPDEDVHSYVERWVTEKLGDLGKRMHTGKSRNDQVATDMRLYMKDNIRETKQLIRKLMQEIYNIAVVSMDIQLPGFTHLQNAQPVLLSHHLLAFFEKFNRDYERFSNCMESVDYCPLGAGALAGNNYQIDRDFVCKELGFKRPTLNSMDTVSDRDYIIDYCSASATLMTHMSGWCEEIVLWASPLINFVKIGDDFTTGSSLMPQKKNPDMAELIRGKSSRVFGNLMTMLALVKSLPLTYNRDLQEDKEPLFDTVKTVQESLDCFTKMVAGLTFNSQTMAAALGKGYVLATDLADYMVQKGIPFREAHELTGKIVTYAIDNDKQLEDLDLKEFKQFTHMIQDDIKEYLTIDAAIKSKNVFGGTANNQVEERLNEIKETFKW